MSVDAGRTQKKVYSIVCDVVRFFNAVFKRQASLSGPCPLTLPDLVMLWKGNHPVYPASAQWNSALSTACDLSGPVSFIYRHPQLPFWVLCKTLFQSFMNWWLEISRFSHKVWVSWRSAVSFGKQMPGVPNSAHRIAKTSCASTPIWIVWPWFQRSGIISAGMITMSTCYRKAWYNPSCLLPAYDHLSTNTKLSVNGVLERPVVSPKLAVVEGRTLETMAWRSWWL